MAQKKSGGSSKNNRDSISKRLGIKKHSSTLVRPGSIIIKQKGLNFKPGLNTIKSKNYSIISNIYGYVNFKIKKNKKEISVF